VTSKPGRVLWGSRGRGEPGGLDLYCGKITTLQSSEIVGDSLMSSDQKENLSGPGRMSVEGLCPVKKKRGRKKLGLSTVEE